MPFTSENVGFLGDLPGDIERAFIFWNEKYWAGKLREPLFTFHPNAPNGRVLGHFAAQRWAPGDGRHRPPLEISFSADLCLKAGAEQILHTLVHEMVHLWQHLFGEVSKYGYHNKQWHLEAQRVGLESTIGDGKGHTAPGPQFKRDLAAFGPWVTKTPHHLGAGTRNRQAKWVCDCGFGVRVAVPYFNATCNACGSQFRLAPSTRRARL